MLILNLFCRLLHWHQIAASTACKLTDCDFREGVRCLIPLNIIILLVKLGTPCATSSALLLLALCFVLMAQFTFRTYFSEKSLLEKNKLVICTRDV